MDLFDTMKVAKKEFYEILRVRAAQYNRRVAQDFDPFCRYFQQEA